MFGLDFSFGRGKLAAENKALRDEVERLKAGSSAAVSSPAGIIAADQYGGSYATHTNLAATRQQLKAFKGWPAVAIGAIAKRVAAAPCHVGYVPEASGAMLTKAADSTMIERVGAHPLLDAVEDPNPFLVRFSLLYLMTVHLLTTGRAFWWLWPNGNRLEIWPLVPSWMEMDRRRSRWLVRPDGATEQFPISMDDVCYFYLPDPSDPLEAWSPLQAAAGAVNLDEELLTAQQAEMVNSARPGVVLRGGRVPPAPGQADATKGPRVEFTPEQRNQILGNFKQAYEGMRKHGKTILTDAVIEEVTEFSNRVADLEWQGGSKQVAGRIMQNFHTNPFITGELAVGSYAAAVASQQQFNEVAVQPILTLAGQVLSGWLAPRFSGPRGERLRVFFEPARAKDDQLEFQKMKAAREKGDITEAEFRIYCGLPAQKPAGV